MVRNLVIRCTATVALIGGLVALVIAIAAPTEAQTLPTLPQQWVDTTMPAATGQRINVPPPPEGNLQDAINSSHPGDEIVLQAGASYGAITLPNKGSSTSWIIIRSSATGRSSVATAVPSARPVVCQGP